MVDIPRLFDSDLTPIEQIFFFNGNDYNMHIQITAFGGDAVKAEDMMTLITENSISKKMDHFSKIARRCEKLQHGDKQLRDHIQVSIKLFHFHTPCLI